MIAQVSCEEMKKIMNNPEFQIIDVRTHYEYMQGKLPNSKLIPMDQIPFRLNVLDKNKKILLYCRSGNRSMVVANFLLQNGFKEIYNLTYGILDCEEILEK